MEKGNCQGYPKEGEKNNAYTYSNRVHNRFRDKPGLGSLRPCVRLLVAICAAVTIGAAVYSVLLDHSAGECANTPIPVASSERGSYCVG